MKTKDVVTGEQTFKIGKLSCGQVDEIIFANFDIKTGRDGVVTVAQGTQRTVRTRISPAIAASLNNAREDSAAWFLHGWVDPDADRQLKALSGSGGAPTPSMERWWTPEEVFSELDYDEMTQLYEEVALLSKLKTSKATVKADKPAGETPAADVPASA